MELELITDPTMHLFIEKGIRGGVSVQKRHAVANNKYMKDYKPNKESVYIPYFDANNLNGAMSQPLPTHGVKWMTDRELANYWQNIPCFLGVSLRYPRKLHDLHNDLPLAPDHVISGVTRALIGGGGGVYIHIFVFCPTDFF